MILFIELADHMQLAIAKDIRTMLTIPLSVNVVLDYIKKVNPSFDKLEEGLSLSDKDGFYEALKAIITDDSDILSGRYSSNMEMIEYLAIGLRVQLAYALDQNPVLMMDDMADMREKMGNALRYINAMVGEMVNDKDERYIALCDMFLRITSTSSMHKGFMKHLMSWDSSRVYDVKDFDKVLELRGRRGANKKPLLVNTMEKVAFLLDVRNGECVVGAKVKFPGIHKDDKVYSGESKRSFLTDYASRHR